MERLWWIRSDMNGDGIISVSDVWLMAKWAFFYPGDLLILGTVNYLPGVAEFLEINYASYGGVLSGILSVSIWLMFAEALQMMAHPAAR